MAWGAILLSPCHFWIKFCRLNFCVLCFLEVKIDINWVNLTPCQAHWVLQNLLLGVAKDEHFSSFNPNWHELRKQEKCLSLAPSRSKYYKTLSLEGCQINPIDVNFHLQKEFRHFWQKNQLTNEYSNLLPGSLHILVTSFFVFWLSKTTKNIFYVGKARQAKRKLKR